MRGFRPMVLITALLLSSAAAPMQAEEPETYLVVYQSSTFPSDPKAEVEASGGRLVQAYPEIGVLVVQSSSLSFHGAMAQKAQVEGVAATRPFATRLEHELGTDVVDDEQPAAKLELGTDRVVGQRLVGANPSFGTPGSTEPLAGLQWDVRQIHTPEAHAVTAGSATVIVGNIDTGIDYTHPDLAPNVDFARSVSCVSGVPDPTPAAWRDDIGHGTHTAGTIAAAVNGIGIAGVAPGVRLATIRAGNANGFFYPEAVVCAFMWAATHQIDIVNNSYFVDPWLFNCRNDPEQRAIWIAVQRAIRFALSRGVTVVSITGNQNMDLAGDNIDTISPDDTTPITREVTNACVQLPVEIPGVIGVSANGNLLQKAYYSSYGLGVADLVAPGGDRLFQLTSEATNGRVLSTYPAALAGGPLSVIDASGATYFYLQGTSMAAPHVAGVAALVLSQFGPRSKNKLGAILGRTADRLACPANPFDPGGNGQFEAFCWGGSRNGFFGAGQVNALRAVTEGP